MKLYMKQKVFSWGDKFRVCDEFENDRFFVKGEVFSFGKKLHIYDPCENELAFIHQKVFSFLPRYFVSRYGTDVAEVIKEFTFLKQRYTVRGPGWTVQGNFWAHEYQISAPDRVIATVSKRWFSWGDSYEIDVFNDADEVMALCVVLIIDAVLAANNNRRTANYD